MPLFGGAFPFFGFNLGVWRKTLVFLIKNNLIPSIIAIKIVDFVLCDDIFMTNKSCIWRKLCRALVTTHRRVVCGDWSWQIDDITIIFHAR